MGAGRGQPARLPRRPSTRRASPRSTPPSWSSRPPSRGANVFEVDYFGRPAYLAQSPQFYKQVLRRRLRAGLRGRSGLPRRAARHGPAPGRVRLARRRARLHRGPPRGDRLPARRGGGDGRRRSTRGPAPRSSCSGIDVPVVPTELPDRCTSARPSRSPAPRPTSPTSPRPTSARSASGRGPSTAATSSSCEGYPTAHRAFYSHPDPDDPHWSRSFDLIFRGLELVSGAQRLHRYDDYVRSARGPRLPLRALRVVRRGVPPRHPAARRLRHRAGALGEPAGRGRQHPRGHALPPRPAPAGAMNADPPVQSRRVITLDTLTGKGWLL